MSSPSDPIWSGASRTTGSCSGTTRRGSMEQIWTASSCRGCRRSRSPMTSTPSSIDCYRKSRQASSWCTAAGRFRPGLETGCWTWSWPMGFSRPIEPRWFRRISGSPLRASTRSLPCMRSSLTPPSGSRVLRRCYMPMTMRPNFARRSLQSRWASESTVSWRSPERCSLRTPPASAPNMTRSSTTVWMTSSGAESLPSTDTKYRRRQSLTWCCGFSVGRSKASSRIGPVASRTFSWTLRACATTDAARMPLPLSPNARPATWTMPRPSKMRASAIWRRSIFLRRLTRRSSVIWRVRWPSGASPLVKSLRSCGNGRAACGWTATRSCMQRSPPDPNC